MSNDNENSLGDQNTFDGGDGQFDPQSLGDEGTFAGGGGYAPQSLGDEVTFGGGANDADDTFDDGMEVVDLESRYKMEGVLGKGGMGEVLLATDTRLNRKVAIKRILGSAARSKTAVSRFLTEAQSVAALNHPNIVQIYDYGRAKDGPFLIMEYVESESLLDKCRKGPIQLEEAVNLTCQLCEGLAKAHAANIIHRDIKPANVLMTPDGVPKLTDFGLAKDDTADTGMTMAGAVLGTLDFMPPEQRKDAALTDNRSDLWSLAASLYQMVTGKSPKIIKFNDVPAALQDVLARALEDEKSDRYQTALEFRDALRECLSVGGPDLSELDTGQCPSCGTKNDSSRRFCRNPDCGESLEAPCLSCNSQIPMWEAVCGSCGAKQEPLVEEAKERKQGERIQAEELLELLDFKKARKLSENLRTETDPRLQQQVKWATDFQDVIETRYQSEMQRVSQLQSEAMQHEESFDYSAAIRTLRQVPETLIYDEVTGFEENVADTLQRLAKVDKHCSQLEKKIKKSIRTRQLAGLLPIVDELRKLIPHRKDLDKLRQQLIDRENKLQRTRDDAVGDARRFIDQQNYPAAIAALKKIDKSLQDKEVQELQEESSYLDHRVKELDTHIESRVTSKNWHGLLAVVEEYLLLQSEDADRVSLRDQLISRENKNAERVKAILDNARQLRENHEFGKALKILQSIPVEIQTEEDAILSQECTNLEHERQQTVRVMKAALVKDSMEELGQAIAKGKAYESLLQRSQLRSHAETANLANQVKNRREQLINQQRLAEKARQASKVTMIVAAGAGGIAALIFIALTIRSTIRSSAVAEARRLSDWKTVLIYFPDDAEAILGSCKTRLSGANPDYGAIREDLDRLKTMDISQASVASVTAELYAQQSRNLTRGGDLVGAENMLKMAEDFELDTPTLEKAKESLALAYSKRADAFALAGDAAGAMRDANKAVSFGAFTKNELLSENVDSAESLLRANELVKAYLATRSDEDLIMAVDGLEALSKFDNVSAVHGELQQSLTEAVLLGCRESLKSEAYQKFSKHFELLFRMDRSAAEAFMSDIPLNALSYLSPSLFADLPYLSNSIGMKLKMIPPGSFTMGSSTEDEKPAHTVNISRPYMIGVYEVTREQFTRAFGGNPDLLAAPNNPESDITWEDAAEFCRKLSALPDEQAAGRRYRLPTEAEWEYACRAGTTTAYGFGDNASALAEHAWYDANFDQLARSVGEKQPNDWGLYDMHGNVWEWCSDWFSMYTASSETDPTGPSSGSSRVLRGGGWFSDANGCRSAFRLPQRPTYREKDYGLRVVCILP